MIAKDAKKNNKKISTIGKTEKSKKTKKKSRTKNLINYRIKILFRYVIILAIVFIVGAALLFAIFFKIEKIEALNSNYYSQEDIIKSTGISKNNNLFLLNSIEVEKGLERKLPYIEKAKVKKEFPNKVVIDVQDAKIAGVVDAGGTYVGISSTGKVLGCLENKAENAFIIEGVKFESLEPGNILKCEDENCQKILLELMGLIEEKNLDNITRIDLSSLTNISVDYQNRIKINFGIFENMDYKIRTAFEIISNKIEKDEKGMLNLSIINKENKSYFTPDHNFDG